MYKRPDMPQYPFLKGQGHFYHHGVFKGDRFDAEFGMENGNFDGQGGPHIFAGKESDGDNSGERFFGRGDLKIVLLKLLQEQSRHGYGLIKELEERFKGFYSPSPGSVYPILQMLEDQDLVNVIKEGRKKVYHLTDEGQAFLKKNQDEDPFTSRMNLLENVNLDEIQTLRSDIQGLFHEFFKVGRQAIEKPEKKEQLQKLLEKTRAELLKIGDDEEKNSDGQ
ncbi:PadR family transcriptional regulator [Gracilibacillus salinarum]|uniref:PadR family transcriptional regulator n=1 Tax=Gracilibacillus salinarum TaxID=2932255 RepID=A0ABY4GGW7_9BACI|nr:PadR family transcriptional regulator [Gracilibacillus salinarum]UOQ83573.1 PadR family transcriptional regulator [Gracilibacillus salinarum]